jgi:hypothetical protein
MQPCSVCGSLDTWADYGHKPVCVGCMCKAIYLTGKRDNLSLDDALQMVGAYLRATAQAKTS